MVKKTKTKEKKSNLFSIISLAAIVIALAITLIFVQKPQDTRNQAASSNNNPCEANCKIDISIGCKRTDTLFGFIKVSYIDYTCQQKIFASCVAKCTLKFGPTPTERLAPTRRPAPPRRPTSTPRPTPITCRNIGLCVRNSKQTVCPTGYRYIGKYGTDCSYGSRFCCIREN